MTMFNGVVISGGGSGGGGTGDVVGPGSATDNAVARFDATTGKLLQDSALTISDVSGSSVTLATTAGNALAISVTAPAATTGASQAGKTASITASNAVASTDTAGAAAGGSVTITAGNAARNTSGNANGGNITLATGSAIGTGTAGCVVLPASGTAAAPAVILGAVTNAGWYRDADVGNYWGYSGSGNASFRLLQAEIQFVSNGVLSWGNQVNSFSGSTSDTGLKRQAAGVVRATDSGSGVGAFLSTRLVEANTAGSGAPNVIVAAESGSIYTNEGVTAENYHTLPSAAAGYVFTFVVQDTDGIRITASSGDTIRPIAGTAASASGGFIRCATAGAFITLIAINSVEWVSIGSSGVWTIDV